MKTEFNPKDYVRLFRFTDVPLIIDLYYLQPKIKMKVLSVNYNNQRTVYIPKEEFEKTLNEGVLIYGTKKTAEEFEFNLREVANSFLNISKGLQNKEVSKKDFQNFKNVLIDFFSLYLITDFLYTDKAHEKGLIRKNLPGFGKLKEDTRVIINNILLSENGLIYPILKSISKQLDIDYNRLLFYTPEELNMAFDGNKFDDSACEERKNFCVVASENNKLVLKENAKEIGELFLAGGKDTIKGTVASKGTAMGRAIIFPDHITSFNDLKIAMEKMQKGDILIAETTSPEIMPACSKAAAIVTNQGGLMSHAAIVSRELKIPCIVGTEDATSIFKTGDIVEVDADKGIVRIIE